MSLLPLNSVIKWFVFYVVFIYAYNIFHYITIILFNLVRQLMKIKHRKSTLD